MLQQFKTIYLQRIDTCKACDQFTKFTGSCKQCGCIMPFKAAIPGSECPLAKWTASTVEA